MIKQSGVRVKLTDFILEAISSYLARGSDYAVFLLSDQFLLDPFQLQ
jgi:predicted nucleic-acid-binding protein